MIFYHGTTDLFEIEDNILKPPIDTGNLREEWREKNLNKVYFTDSLLSAEKFAYKASEKYGGNSIVYKIKPIGDVIHPNTNEYMADGAKIIGICARYIPKIKKWDEYEVEKI